MEIEYSNQNLIYECCGFWGQAEIWSSWSEVSLKKIWCYRPHNFAKLASETPNHHLLGTRGPRDRNHGVSVYETCACVIHTNLLSYIIIVISH